jgi:WD40 repeat protein
VSRPEEPRRTDLAAPGDAVGAVAMTPEPGRAITADRSGRVVVWDVSDPAQARQLGTIDGHTDAVLVGLSGDGRLAVTASEDNTSVLWDLHDPARPGRITALTGPGRPLVRGVALSPDGHRVLGASAGRTVSVWDLTSVAVLADPHAAACRMVGTGLPEPDWNRFVTDLPYRPTCP